MKSVLEILKRYWVEAACGLGAALGIALIVFGLGAMKDVQSELTNAMTVKTSIGGLTRGEVINQRAVDQSAKLIANVKSGFAQVMTFVRERNFYPPLVPDAFPGDTAANVNKAIEFRKAFAALRRQWIDKLKAGAEPSPAEIAAERDRMEAQGKTEKEASPGGVGTPPEEPKKAPSGPTPEQAAALAIARKHYCYATVDSFQDSTVSAAAGPMASGPPPTVNDMWNAQLEAWVQQTVVDAIAQVNEQAAEGLQKRSAAPWVGNLPIKDLRFLQTTRYYVKEGLALEPAGNDKDRPYPPGSAAAAFTGRQSNEQYELMQFTVQLVVDARELPRVLAGLCERRFHVPLRVEYAEIEPNLAMVGKIYGDAPVVLMTADFETVMFSDLYLPLMPQDVLTALGKTRPEPPAAQP